MATEIRAGLVSDIPPGSVVGAGRWAVGNVNGEFFALSRRCRHLFADLAGGKIDRNGCLVCPWHQSRYDVGSGEMVEGPKGFLGYHGPAPAYAQLVTLLGRLVPLRVRRAVRRGDDVVVG